MRSFATGMPTLWNPCRYLTPPPTQQFSRSPEAASRGALDDVLHTISTNGGRLPLGRVLQKLSKPAVAEIIKSGKGLEGWVKHHSAKLHIDIDKTSGVKYLVIPPQVKEEVARLEAQNEKVKIPPVPRLSRLQNGSVFLQPSLELPADFFVDPNESKYAGDRDPDRAPFVQMRTLILSKMQPGIRYSFRQLSTLVFGKYTPKSRNDLDFIMKLFPQDFQFIPEEGKETQFMIRDSTAELHKENKGRSSGEDPLPADRRRLHKPPPGPHQTSMLLAYVPIHWLSLSCIVRSFPPEQRNRFPRGLLAWFASLPRYVELRLVGEGVEMRRAPRLNPDRHAMTQEQAEAYFAHQVAEDHSKKILQKVQTFGKQSGSF